VKLKGRRGLKENGKKGVETFQPRKEGRDWWMDGWRWGKVRVMSY